MKPKLLLLSLTVLLMGGCKFNDFMDNFDEKKIQQRDLERVMSTICPIGFHGACEFKGVVGFCPDSASPKYWREANSVKPTKEVHQKLGVKWPCGEHDENGDIIR